MTNLNSLILIVGLTMNYRNRKLMITYYRFAFCPFSSGPRNCIGQHMAMIEAKVMLIYVLLNYKLLPDPKRELEMTLPVFYIPLDDRLVHF